MTCSRTYTYVAGEGVRCICFSKSVKVWKCVYVYVVYDGISPPKKKESTDFKLADISCKFGASLLQVASPRAAAEDTPPPSTSAAERMSPHNLRHFKHTSKDRFVPGGCIPPPMYVQCRFYRQTFDAETHLQHLHHRYSHNSVSDGMIFTPHCIPMDRRILRIFSPPTKVETRKTAQLTLRDVSSSP